MPITDGPALTERERKRLLAEKQQGSAFSPFARVFGSFDKGTVFDYGEFEAAKVAEAMRKDGKVRSTFEVLTLPIRGASWKIEETEGDTGEAKFVRDALGERMGLIIDQCTTAIAYCRAFFEYDWKLLQTTDTADVAGNNGRVVNQRGKAGPRVVFDRIDMRPAEGCEAGFDPNTGDPRGFRQRVVAVAGYSQTLDRNNPGYKTVPGHRSFIYTHGGYREPIKGVSDLDVALWCYETKQKILYLLFRFLETQSHPKLIVYGDDPTQAEELAQDVAATIAGGVIGLPRGGEPGAKAYDIVESAGQGASQFMAAITYLDSMMVQAVLAGFTELAASPNGSYALSADQSEFFLASRQAIADEIADAIRDGLFRPLILNNFGPEGKVPKLVIGPLSNRDTDRALSLLTAVVAAPQLNIPGGFVDLLTQGVSGFLGIDPGKVEEFLKDFAVKREEQDKLKMQQQQALLTQQAAPPPPGSPPGARPLRGAAAILSGTGKPTGAQMKQQKANQAAQRGSANANPRQTPTPAKAGAGNKPAGARPTQPGSAKGPSTVRTSVPADVQAAFELVARITSGQTFEAAATEILTGEQ